jgi:prophage maintenance system killer protein
MMNHPLAKATIFQAANGAIEFRGDFERDTIWGTQKQIANLFDLDRSVVTRHIHSIFNDNELNKTVVSAKFALTTVHGAISGKSQTRLVEHYNLDIILAVGYRTNSAQAIEFRKWATTVLRQHILHGYTINRKRVGLNYDAFMQAVTEVRALLPDGLETTSTGLLDLIGAFAETWFSLDAYDKAALPRAGSSQKATTVTAMELQQALAELKANLIQKNEANELFGAERNQKSIEGIIGSVFQSAFGEDAYPSLEEKAAHLLYFIVKNHPFTDGNKRSGAFSFVWFLKKAGLLRASLTPEALTTLTLLVAQSQPDQKPKIIGLIILLLDVQSNTDAKH